jgi:hypothetical protein
MIYRRKEEKDQVFDWGAGVRINKWEMQPATNYELALSAPGQVMPVVISLN